MRSPIRCRVTSWPETASRGAAFVSPPQMPTTTISPTWPWAVRRFLVAGVAQHHAVRVQGVQVALLPLILGHGMLSWGCVGIFHSPI